MSRTDTEIFQNTALDSYLVSSLQPPQKPGDLYFEKQRYLFFAKFIHNKYQNTKPMT